MDRKGKTSLKVGIPTIRGNPNASSKLQKWRYYFESNATIDKEHDIKIGKSKLLVKPTSNGTIKGYYEFSFSQKEFINKEKADKIAKKDLAYFDKVFLFKGVQLSPKWKRLVCINSKQFIKQKFRYSKIVFTYNLVAPHFSKEIIDAFPNLLRKIERSKHREQILNCLDWMDKETESDLERFLFKWISFNILYSTKYPTSGDTESIENFSKHGIEYSKIESLLENHKKDLEGMTKLKLLSRTKVNHSKKLKLALAKDKKSDILRHSLMCIWIIRGDLFHKGKQYDVFLGNLASYIRDVTKLGILKIL